MNDLVKKFAGEAISEAVLPAEVGDFSLYDVYKIADVLAQKIVTDVMTEAWKESDRFLVIRMDDCSKAMENFHELIKKRYG